MKLSRSSRGELGYRCRPSFWLLPRIDASLKPKDVKKKRTKYNKEKENENEKVPGAESQDFIDSPRTGGDDDDDDDVQDDYDEG
jgi:hypothetical protein